MIADVNIKDYYLQFIHDAEIDANEYKEKLNLVLDAKKSVYEYLNENKNILDSAYNVQLDSFEKEWTNKEYDVEEPLYKMLVKLVQLVKEDKDKEVLLQAIKYCNILRQEYKYTKLIDLTTKRKKITFKEYKKHVSNFYIKIHKCLLNGMGYRFANGIGTYVINYWKMDPTMTKYKNRIDYGATSKRKKEILDKGLKLYDAKEAEWYKARNLPYDGVDYRVYKHDTSFYEFTLIRSKLFKNNLDYKRTEYVNLRYRGLSYEQIADKYCETQEDIYSLQVDIRYKLNILLYKDPTKYLNFIRNVEQVKYKHRENYCSN